MYEEFFEYLRKNTNLLREDAPTNSQGPAVSVSQKGEAEQPQQQRVPKTRDLSSLTPADFEYGNSKNIQIIKQKNYFPLFLKALNKLITSGDTGLKNQVAFKTNGAEYAIKTEGNKFIALDVKDSAHTFYPMISSKCEYEVNDFTIPPTKEIAGDKIRLEPDKIPHLLFKEDFKAFQRDGLSKKQSLNTFTTEEARQISNNILKAAKAILRNYPGNITLGKVTPTEIMRERRERMREDSPKSFSDSQSIEIEVIYTANDPKSTINKDALIQIRSELINKLKGKIKTDSTSTEVIFNPGSDDNIRVMGNKGLFTIIASKGIQKKRVINTVNSVLGAGRFESKPIASFI